ncbi:MAG: UDP-N-acetyl glucosamine 2-epimerase [bacterium]
MKKIVSIIGTRPQYIKLKPIYDQFNKIQKKLNNQIKHLIINTSQHYDYNMSKIFFEDLLIENIDYHLDIDYNLVSNQGEQTALMIKKIEEILLKINPDLVIVYGDTNSTLAASIVSSKLKIPIAHIESGLRSYNKLMPEEINRILTDNISTLLFCPTKNAIKNLKKEGFKNLIPSLISYQKINKLNFKKYNINNPLAINVGDIMYDLLNLIIKEIKKKYNKIDILKKLNILPLEYILLTIHRQENTENTELLKELLIFVKNVSKIYNKKIIFPIHPRTKKILNNIKNLNQILNDFVIIDPLKYTDNIFLVLNSFMVLTDSGGLQKEAYLLKVPTITLRNETEWIETLKNNFNILYKDFINKFNNIHPLSSKRDSFFNEIFTKNLKPNEFGDTKASNKIVKIITKYLNY